MKRENPTFRIDELCDAIRVENINFLYARYGVHAHLLQNRL